MSLPRMSLHIGDYKKDTGHLRAAGHGAYFLLMMHYWATGGLPNDDAQLAAIACMSGPEWKKHKPTIKAFFKAGEWKHKRIDAEIADATERYERRAAAGKRGGEAKAKGKQPPSNASGNATAKAYQPLTLTEKEVRGEGEDAREGISITPEAFALSERLTEAAGWDRDDPRVMGNPWTAQKWLNGKWNPDLCVETVRRVCASSRKKINTLAYFENPIAEAHAQQSAPLPVVVVSQTPEVINGKTQRGNIQDASRRLVENIRKLNEPAPDGIRSGEGGAHVRLLSQG